MAVTVRGTQRKSIPLRSEDTPIGKLKMADGSGHRKEGMLAYVLGPPNSAHKDWASSCLYGPIHNEDMIAEFPSSDLIWIDGPIASRSELATAADKAIGAKEGFKLALITGAAVHIARWPYMNNPWPKGLHKYYNGPTPEEVLKDRELAVTAAKKYGGVLFIGANSHCYTTNLRKGPRKGFVIRKIYTYRRMYYNMSEWKELNKSTEERKKLKKDSSPDYKARLDNSKFIQLWEMDLLIDFLYTHARHFFDDVMEYKGWPDAHLAWGRSPVRSKHTAIRALGGVVKISRKLFGDRWWRRNGGAMKPKDWEYFKIRTRKMRQTIKDIRARHKKYGITKPTSKNPNSLLIWNIVYGKFP